MIPMVLTPEEIAAAKNSDERQKDICRRVAENLVLNNPALRWAYNSAGVYVRNDNGSIALIYSWTCFGSFIAVQPFLDVTRYAKDLVDLPQPALATS